jgi:hypothetical protein
VIGISCYSSTDLYNWKNEGIVLPAIHNDPEHDLHPSKVLERPKVIWNSKTQKFLLYVHVDNADYHKACVGVAVSDQPTGPYQYLGSFRPNGNDSRDMTAICIEDHAFLVFSSEWNKTIHVVQMDEEFLKPTKIERRLFIDQSREAPVVFSIDNKNYFLSSACTGWEPNQTQLAISDSILGNWTLIGNPCVGPDAELTFHAQSAYVFQVMGRQNEYIAMFDRWNKHDLRDSRYVWLPILTTLGKIEIPWLSEWDLSIFD